jgi:hypothetical protein
MTGSRGRRGTLGRSHEGQHEASFLKLLMSAKCQPETSASGRWVIFQIRLLALGALEVTAILEVPCAKKTQETMPQGNGHFVPRSGPRH